MDTPCFLLLMIGITIHNIFIFAQETDELDIHPKFHEHERLSTKHRPMTTAKLVKRDAEKQIDLTFPGCGLRSPKIPKRRFFHSSKSRCSSRRRNSSLQGRTVSESFQSDGGMDPKEEKMPLVVGGVAAKDNSWPWMAAIFEGKSPRISANIACGGSLISKKYVLSAAHCFVDENGRTSDPSKYIVVFGSNIAKDGTEYPVKKILIHHKYKKEQNYNDISLLQIQNEVKLTAKVYPVCLPSGGLHQKIDRSNNVKVTGWGQSSAEGGSPKKLLQEVTVSIVPLKECNTTYSKLSLPGLSKGITNDFICAGVKEGGKGPCFGDSGGPLVSKLKGNSYVQLGIVSFGAFGCAEPGVPSVFTRVSHYTKWLYDNTDLGKA